ncbi:MAG: hypothetical protein CMM29_09625 [Rhodospirillaceae bacterium]|nr:hypothetical protein [Rhodospirillaceae bacterium]MBR87037.1 hypothetical protein [Rhodospirillaceae bacterium]
MPSIVVLALGEGTPPEVCNCTLQLLAVEPVVQLNGTVEEVYLADSPVLIILGRKKANANIQNMNANATLPRL